MMPGMFAEAFRKQNGSEAPVPQEIKCPDCGNVIPKDSRFCPLCGHQQLVYSQCASCGKNLPPNAAFCPRCGQAVDQKPRPITCFKCGMENLPGATYCNKCGEKL